MVKKFCHTAIVCRQMMHVFKCIKHFQIHFYNYPDYFYDYFLSDLISGKIKLGNEMIGLRMVIITPSGAIYTMIKKFWKFVF